MLKDKDKTVKNDILKTKKDSSIWLELMVRLALQLLKIKF